MMRMKRLLAVMLALCALPLCFARADAVNARLTAMYASFLMQFGPYVPADTAADATLTENAARYGEKGALLPAARAGATFFDRKGNELSAETLTQKTMSRVYAAMLQSADGAGLDLSVLADCANLTELRLYGVPVKGLDALKECKSLTSLLILVSAPDAPILTFVQARIASLTELTVISVADEPLSLPFLAKAGKLKTLTLLGGFSIADEALASLKSLTRASLLFFGRQTLNLNALLKNEKLSVVNVSWNALAGLDKIGQPSDTRITALNVSDCGLADVSFIRRMARLTSLDLSGNELTDLSQALTGKGNLETLRLDENPLTHPESIPWANMKKLTELSLNDCGLEDIAFIRPLKTLVTLNLAGNRVADLSALDGFQSLVTLDVSNNRVADVSALAGLRRLRGLNLRGNGGMMDLSPLSACARLAVLYVPEGVPGESLSALRAALPDCLIE